MNLNRLLLTGATCLISILSVSGSAVEVLANSSSKVVPSISTEANTVVAQMNQTTAIMTGTFVAAEKPTTGTARIVEQSGVRYLELDSAFSASSQGPDLHVVLDPAQKPPQAYKGQDAGKYVNLGKLQKVKGAQRYPIPNSINLASFKSVGIWCRMANATFGYAPLRPASTASK